MRDTQDRIYDVAIVGGGASGTMAAIALARHGMSVTLIDIHAKHPKEFRCEKIAAEQLEMVRRLHLTNILGLVSTPIDHMHVVRAGGIHERLQSDEFGFHYADFVNALRDNLPANAEFILGRVTDIRTSENEQEVILADGRKVGARLVVLATGLGHGLRQKLGVRRRMTHEQHSLCIGLSIKPEAGFEFRFPGLTYYSENTGYRTAYVSIFPIGDVMRANVFSYHGYRDPFVSNFRQDPVSTLYGVMPGLKKYTGNFEVVGDVDVRMVDLYITENCEQNGVVLIGDAFSTSCPAAGTGLTRCMSDVERLARLAPALMATPGMSKDKLAAFYADPVKVACDAKAIYAARYTRNFATHRGINWKLRRLRANMRTRINATRSGLGEISRASNQFA